MLSKYDIKNNEDYREKIKNGVLELLSESDGNWNMYIDQKGKYVYYVAKTDSCCSGMFGDITYYFKRFLSSNYKYDMLTKKAYDMLLKTMTGYYYKRNIEEIANQIKIIA